MNAYELRQALRKSRQADSADNAREAAAALFEAARRSIEHIPPGQPILVGHHSERRHRRDLARHDRLMDKACAMQKRAEQLAGRAATVSNAISSDDPDAPDKLEAKIAKLEAQQERMTATNKLVRKNDRAGLAAMGYGEAMISELFTPQYGNGFGPIGIPPYALSNNNANIRRLKERLASLQRRETAPERPDVHAHGVTIRHDKDDNRLHLIFPGKPAAEMREKLKSHGFRWSPDRGAWVRMLNNSAVHAASYVLGLTWQQVIGTQPVEERAP